MGTNRRGIVPNRPEALLLLDIPGYGFYNDFPQNGA
jgi:GTP-binding protein EngB required for normal cell division